jgi:hypothetical protein
MSFEGSRLATTELGVIATSDAQVQRAELREMILTALEDSGGVSYLMRQAKENPTAFLALLGKVLPLQLAGVDGRQVEIRVVTGVPRSKPVGASCVQEGGPNSLRIG